MDFFEKEVRLKPFYDHGGIVIYHADWRDVPIELLKADLLLTDPPFGIGEAKGKNKSRTKLAVAKDYGTSDWDDQQNHSQALCLPSHQHQRR